MSRVISIHQAFSERELSDAQSLFLCLRYLEGELDRGGYDEAAMLVGAAIKSLNEADMETGHA